MMVQLSKYHGLGNDFIITKASALKGINPSDFAKHYCDRHVGLGADGLILVKENPLTMLYYNSDGSVAKMCGNGIRCFAKFCIDQQVIQDEAFDVQTLAGTYHVSIQEMSPFLVRVNMGRPNYQALYIPMKIEKETWINQLISFNHKHYQMTSLLMGATHSVIEVDDMDTLDCVGFGKMIQSLPIFPDSTNVNFFHFLDASTVRVQTFERGAGLTLACGTGATAVYAVLKDVYGFKGKLTIVLQKGSLSLESNEVDEILMTGPAKWILNGEVAWEK